MRSTEPNQCRSIGRMMPRTGIRLPTRTMAGAHNSDAAAPISNFLREIIYPFRCRMAASLVETTLPGRQVGEGVSPTLDAIQSVAVFDMDVELSSQARRP